VLPVLTGVAMPPPMRNLEKGSFDRLYSYVKRSVRIYKPSQSSII